MYVFTEFYRGKHLRCNFTHSPPIDGFTPWIYFKTKFISFYVNWQVHVFFVFLQFKFPDLTAIGKARCLKHYFCCNYLVGFVVRYLRFWSEVYLITVRYCCWLTCAHLLMNYCAVFHYLDKRGIFGACWKKFKFSCRLAPFVCYRGLQSSFWEAALLGDLHPYLTNKPLFDHQKKTYDGWCWESHSLAVRF